jgi:AraC-like DNA-binding protein
MSQPRSGELDALEGSSFTVAASGLRGFLAYAAARRADLTDVLAVAGLSAVDLEGPEARISQAANNAVIADLAVRMGDDDLGLHVAERLDLDALGVVGHLAAKSTTLGEAFARVCQLSRILHDSGRVDLEHHEGEVVLFPGCRGLHHEFPRHVAEFSSLAALVLARRVTNTAIVPRRVAFQHPAPTRLSEHLRLFSVVPQFEQVETSIAFEPSALALRITDAQPGLVSYLEAYAREVIARLPADTGLSARVERIVTSSLARGLPRIEAVASQLGLSGRTLQRRLGEDGTSFAAIVDRARQALAQRYIADDKLSLAEVGFLVGFADPSNFHRAFRRWTGATPAAFRARRP